MNETRVNWWMDASSHWHRGRPPAAWWQAEDGRWHPPGDDDPTVEMRDGPPAGAAHLAGGPYSPTDVDGWDWPRWARISVLPALALVAVVLVGAAAITGGGRDDGQATATAETTTSAGGTTAAPPNPTTEPPRTTSTDSTSSSEVADPSAPPSTELAPTTTTAAPPTTTPPPSNAAVSPGAGCSPEGATALTEDGVPMTCTRQKCHGAPFDTARWRRTAC